MRARLSSGQTLSGCALVESKPQRRREASRLPAVRTTAGATLAYLSGRASLSRALQNAHTKAGQCRAEKRTVRTRRHAEAEMSVSNESADDKSASEEAAEPNLLSQELGNVQSPASVWLPQPDISDKVPS